MVESTKIYLLILILFFSFPSFGKLKPIAVSGVVSFQTKSLYRGALTWNKPSYFLGPGFVFYEKFALRGPGLSYQHFKRNDKYVFNLALQAFNDRRPLLSFSSDGDGLKNSRDVALDFSVEAGYKFGFRNLFEFGGEVSRDFIEHKGLYVAPYFKLPVAPFVTLKTSLGVGEKNTNQYLYGDTAESGAGFYELNLQGFVPKFFKKGFLILSLAYTSVLNSSNREGVLIEGKPDNLNFSMRFICKFY